MKKSISVPSDDLIISLACLHKQTHSWLKIFTKYEEPRQGLICELTSIFCINMSNIIYTIQFLCTSVSDNGAIATV